ncbi:hypothetical protein ACQY0O_006987 [Thecaphora frezii]
MSSCDETSPGNERRHVCPEPDCNAAFAQIIDLHRHQLSHALRHRFSCTACSALFTRLDGLERHLRRKHPHLASASAETSVRHHQGRAQHSASQSRAGTGDADRSARPTLSSHLRHHRNRNRSVSPHRIQLAPLRLGSQTYPSNGPERDEGRLHASSLRSAGSDDATSSRGTMHGSPLPPIRTLLPGADTMRPERAASSAYSGHTQPLGHSSRQRRFDFRASTSTAPPQPVNPGEWHQLMPDPLDRRSRPQDVFDLRHLAFNTDRMRAPMVRFEVDQNESLEADDDFFEPIAVMEAFTNENTHEMEEYFDCDHILQKWSSSKALANCPEILAFFACIGIDLGVAEEAEESSDDDAPMRKAVAGPENFRPKELRKRATSTRRQGVNPPNTNRRNGSGKTAPRHESISSMKRRKGSNGEDISRYGREGN